MLDNAQHKKRIIVTVRQIEGEDKEKELKDIIEFLWFWGVMLSRVLASHSVSAAAIDDVCEYVYLHT